MLLKGYYCIFLFKRFIKCILQLIEINEFIKCLMICSNIYKIIELSIILMKIVTNLNAAVTTHSLN